MVITRRSMVSGVVRTRDLPITEGQLKDYYERGIALQVVFKDLSPADREFIKTGITDQEWDDLFPEQDA